MLSPAALSLLPDMQRRVDGPTYLPFNDLVSELDHYRNKELAFQNEEKEKRAEDLIILSEDLKAQQEELRRANDEILKSES